MSLHMPENNQQWKQCNRKGHPGPVKAIASVTRTKSLILIFFDLQGEIYINTVSKGTMANSTFIRIVLGRLMMVVKKKRPIYGRRRLEFNWANSPVLIPALYRTAYRR
jgi:hypothetical protein